MATTSDIKKGFTFKQNGKMYIVLEFLHVKPGKGGAFVRTKVKNIETSQVVDMTFKSGETLEEIRLEKNSYEFLYKDGEQYVFMNNETYEQIHVDEKTIGDKKYFLKENTTVDLLSVEDKIIDISLPIFVELKITQTEPGVKGNTVSGANKPAICETGLKINIPLFVNEGEIIKIDTRTGEYVERV